MRFPHILSLVLAASASCAVQAEPLQPKMLVGAIPRGGRAPALAKDKVASIPPLVVTSKGAAVVMGLLLAFNSGFINGCCLSGAVAADGSKQAVAAVTASWTNSAMGLASGNVAQFQFLAKVIMSFISGSAISGFLNPRPTPFLFDGSSQYGSSLFIAAALLCVAAGQLQDADSVKTGFYLAAMANGIQNSVTSTLTQNLCRSSHFTGISSDMGTFLGQILRGNQENLFKLQVFMGLSVCFWLGGYVSFEASKQYESSCLFLSAGFYVLMGGLYGKLANVFLSSKSKSVKMD
jgi:hypothetical protein